MAGMNEAIVREYFESLGYLVRQTTKYQVTARGKVASEEADLLVVHPAATAHEPPGHVLWTGPDLAGVARAVVGIRGWHSERFSPSVVRKSPEITRIADPDVLRRLGSPFGDLPAARILCLSSLAEDPRLRDKVLAALKAKGIHGVLLFPTMLIELIDRVDAHRNYDKSDVLQLLRILKRHQLVRDTQLDLFRTPRRRSSAKAPDEPEEA